MKAKLTFLVLAGLLIASCSSKKSVAVTKTNVPKETPKEVVLTPELMGGKNLYENSCVKCHKLYNPKEYSQEDWKPILTRMQKKAHLDDVQIASISNYISSQL
jgi:cytochrome c5